MHEFCEILWNSKFRKLLGGISLAPKLPRFQNFHLYSRLPEFIWTWTRGNSSPDGRTNCTNCLLLKFTLSISDRDSRELVDTKSWKTRILHEPYNSIIRIFLGRTARTKLVFILQPQQLGLASGPKHQHNSRGYSIARMSYTNTAAHALTALLNP